MKKLLLILLAVLMLLTACSETVSESSQEEESQDYGGPYMTLVSYGKPYTLNVSTNEKYIDTYGVQLTDGQKVSNEGAHYVDSRMVGFTKNCTVQIDLGEEDGKRIKKIVARSLEMHQDGVTLAASARFMGSTDGEKFKTLGTRPFTESSDLTVCEVSLELEDPADYRYIRVQFYKGTGVFWFTDEIEVYADVAPKETEDKSAVAYMNENIDRNAWQAMSTGVSANPADTKNLSVGQTYSFSDCGFDERAPESDTLLTDGARTKQYFSDSVWVGLTSDGSKSPAVTVALEEAHNNIYAFKVYALGGGVDVDLPAYIDVYAAKADEYTFVGRMYGPDQCDNFTYTLLLSEYIEAQNVRFVFPQDAGSYWIEEIEVIAGYNEEQPDLLYPPLDLPTVTEDIFWDSSEEDYKTEQNLLLGLTQQINPLFYADIETRGNESPADFPYLTDGLRATNMYCYSGQWFFSGGGDGIEFIYDLGKVSTVNSTNISLLEQEPWGIIRPKFMSVFLSDDGQNWYEVAEYTRDTTTYYQSETRVEIPLVFDKAYAARFIRFRVEGGAIFIDELEAFGTKEVKSSVTRLADSGIAAVPLYTNAESEAFASTENTPIKAENLIFVYGDRNKPEDLLPMVAYLDEDGNITDTFMDGFIYCSHNQLPSGTQAHLPNYKIDWDYVIDKNFNGDISFDVLDQTVGQVKEALNIPDYKVQVYVSFLTLRQEVTDFGDVDGDGISEDASTVEGRRKIFDWYIDLNLRTFEEKNYQNLELNGFYWVNESVIWESDDSQVITEAGQAVHDAGSNFLWVPYFEANRYFTGYELGFDVISMQPNVVFTTDAPYWRFDATASATKKYKMSVEIEHSYQAMGDPEFARTYMMYLYYGAKTGYMNGIKIYYDDVNNFSKLGYSDSALCRMQYDATYNFAKRTLEITPEKRDDVTVKGSKDTVISGTLNPDNALSMFTLVSSTENGYIAFGEDGSFRYYPDKGFTGNDSFTYTYNNFLGESEVCTVNITVEG